ncbi:tripartite tricarboxylate transporter substrate binding protein [Roseiarcaceae bacterium H3SJ34-1]|uniref:Bug family tripartite tricarboxylate transporter substrate binding protein n=1 Tax=Terripilifer ovatus TaxID=3032367 RepID=UPI003AB973D1|nr:tripartite tricarboxylate transporter substrate binding protein [Roseiarcaceae bacterium H3SJ34-1]
MKRAYRAAAFAGLAAFALPATAQQTAWPERSVRFIVPFPAGGPTDIIARVMGQKMSERLGQSFVVDNRGGAGGVTGTDAVAKSAPDGYTMALTSAGALAISPALQRMPYQPVKDLKPVSLVAKVPELLVVPPDSPAKDVAGLVALAKSKPGVLNYASTGLGSMPQLAAELLKSTAGLAIVHVPYTGAAPAVNDLLVSRTDLMFADIPVLLPHVEAGKLRALAVGSAQRAPSLPNVPTFAEQGLRQVEAENWYGIVVAGTTPAPIVAKLHAAIVEALNSPDVKDKLAPQGAVLVGSTPEEFTAYILAETAKWAEVVKVSGVKLE